MSNISELKREKRIRENYGRELNSIKELLPKLIESLRQAKGYFAAGGYYVDGQTLDQCGSEMTKDLEQWIIVLEGNVEKVIHLISSNNYYIDILKDRIIALMKEEEK